MSTESMAVNSLKFGVWFVLAASMKIMCILAYFPVILRLSSFSFNIMYLGYIITMTCRQYSFSKAALLTFWLGQCFGVGGGELSFAFSGGW